MSIYTFVPVYQERLWGGRALEELYGRRLPPHQSIGESWELCDREEICSILQKPEREIKNLHDLWTLKRKEVFGDRAPQTKYFPILLKIIDATQKLSIQVHPSLESAKKWKGEPKTELWYFLSVKENARIYAGLKRRMTQAEFKKSIDASECAKWLHELAPHQSDVMFLPSGRIHSIGAGNVIFEIAQNSDTTYRLDDWKRLDRGQPRELHIPQSLDSINFNDFEPALTQPHGERVLECAYFSVRRTFIFPGEYRTWNSDGSSFQYHFLAQGDLIMDDLKFKKGEGWLVSANHPSSSLTTESEGAELVTVEFGNG